MEQEINKINETIDNGETEVQVATIGTVIGSDIEGNAVEQHFTEESLQKIAENTTEEVLVDAEHSSEKGGTTEAKGWLSKLNFIPGKGLIGSIKWTDIGRKLVENRVFRWLSPSWLIDKTTKEPIAMTSVALTNKPSQMGRIDPIINNLPNEEKITMEMNKEELINLIKDTIVEMNSCSDKNKMEVKNEVVDQPKVEETKEELKALIEEIIAEKAKEEAIRDIKEEAIEDAIEKKSGIVEVIDACGKKDNTVKNETVVEDPKEEEKKEVIKEEALNSAPVIGEDISVEPEWKKLHGREFLDWYKKNYRNYR